jgi:L-malate glycosyltransferase
MEHILFVESGVYEGGSFMSLVKHIGALDKTRFSPVIVFFNKNKWVDIFKEKGYTVYVLHDSVFSLNSNKFHTALNALFMKGFVKFGIVPFLKFLHYNAIKQVEKIIFKHKIDFVHLNTELFRDRIGLIAAANRNIPVISHLRSKYEIGKIHFSKEYVAYANNKVQKFVAVSEDTALFWKKEVKLSESKFQVLYDYFEPIEKNSDPFDFEGLKLVCAANIIPVKGYEFLLQSCAPILKEFNAKLFILGKGEENYIQTLKSEIKKLDIQKSVEFLGYRNNVSDFIQKSNLVLLFSKREGLPNVIIETMGAGSIIVATNVGGVPEIVVDQVNGFLIDYGEVKAATDKIRSILLKDEEVIKTIKHKAIKTVEFKFSKENYSSRITKLYE